MNSQKRFCCWGLWILIVIVLMTGCDFVYRLLQREGAEEKDLIGEMIPFEPNHKVEEIQKLLKLYGYQPGRIDGGLGYNTRVAIEKFQHDNELKATKFVDKATWEKLNIFNDRGLVTNGEVNFLMVQTALKNAGFNPGKVDGKEGQRTEEALKKFQKAMGLKPDGHIGFKTLAELNDFLPQSAAPANSKKSLTK